MNRTPGLNRHPHLLLAAVRGAWWGLPWVTVLAISASVAYAMTAAVAGGPAAHDAPTTSVVAQAPADALVSGVPGWSAPTLVGIDRVSTDEACDTSGGRLLYVGLNSWIRAEAKVASCPEHAP